MQKFIKVAALAALLLTTGAQAGLLDPDYVSIKSGTAMTEKGKGFEEPLKNVIGGTDIRTELEVAYNWFPENKYSKYVFLYAWKYGDEKHNEIGFGGGAKFEAFHLSKNILVGWKASAGYGWQDNKGKSFDVETNSNAITYATNSIVHGNFIADAIEETKVFEINLGADLQYSITKNLGLDLGCQYGYRNYSYGYKVRGAGMSTYLSGIVQDSHYFNAGLTYKF